MIARLERNRLWWPWKRELFPATASCTLGKGATGDRVREAEDAFLVYVVSLSLLWVAKCMGTWVAVEASFWRQREQEQEMKCWIVCGFLGHHG